jgi:hypothetical protein
MLEYALMGAQAAGLVGDIWASSTSTRIRQRGQALEEQQLDLQLKQERLASNEQSLANLEQLQEVLATQRAMASISGGLPGIGSNLAIEQRSVSNFNKDEKARLLNLEFSAQHQKAKIAVGRLTSLGKQAESGAKIFNQAFNMIPLNEWYDKIKTPTKMAPIEKAKPTTVKKSGILTGSK